ncbi:hypothetical protein [Leifsonia poae]|uniref:hypothetical protein n=1 Tax=Leifsonia poae TaxID=110933 RepID=UPI003D67BA0E
MEARADPPGTGRDMEQRKRPSRWAFTLGAAAIAVVLVSAGVVFAVSTTLPDQPGESVGVSSVTVDNGPIPTGTPSSTPTPTPTDTGAVVVPAPTPLPADDHGGDNGNRGKGGGGGGGDDG